MGGVGQWIPFPLAWGFDRVPTNSSHRSIAKWRATVLHAGSVSDSFPISQAATCALKHCLALGDHGILST